MSDFTTKLPKNLYRAEQVRELDRIAIEDKGIAGFELMQGQRVLPLIFSGNIGPKLDTY
ncbi:MAG: hypothetical protein CM1200mP40_04970 [Gammaproteobacteria bacterium]|nr:MAG: hypothetical protein CM1200mP40_04970 [Gammaproteobacteria bacterium]